MMDELSLAFQGPQLTNTLRTNQINWKGSAFPGSWLLGHHWTSIVRFDMAKTKNYHTLYKGPIQPEPELEQGRPDSEPPVVPGPTITPPAAIWRQSPTETRKCKWRRFCYKWTNEAISVIRLNAGYQLK